MRILVADDDPLVRKIIATLLSRWDHQVVLTENGTEAWQILECDEIHFVISDWMMPLMDGLELCRRVRAANFSHYIYFILLTGRDDKASLVEGMEAGADDFLVKPVHKDELRVRIRAGERILTLQCQLEERNRKLSALNQSLKEAYDTIRQDLEAAAAMQKALLPKPATLQGVTMDWLFRPCDLVAGDTFSYFPLSDRHLGFYLLDVAGHGIPSALLSFTLNTVLSQKDDSALLRQPTAGYPHYAITPPQTVVQELNRRFEADADSMLYFTMIYGVIDTVSNRITLTQAGHPCPMWIRRAEPSAARVGTGGFPVGMLPNVTYEPLSIPFAEGDRLFIYSDGITECQNSQGELFSEARLREIIERHNARPLQKVIETVGEALSGWRDGAEQYDDDISLLALERGANPGQTG